MRKALLKPWMMVLPICGLLFDFASAQFPADYLFGDHLTGTDFTIAGWFNAPSAQTTDAAIISNKNWGSGGNPGFVLTADARGAGTGHQWKVNANGVGGTRADTDWTDFSLNQWVYIAATFDRDGNLTAFHNGGSLAGGSTSTRPMPTGLIDTAGAPNYLDFNIGQDGTGNYDGGQGFIGRIDDVAVWRRALSDVEISGIFNAATSNQSLGSLFGTSLNGGLNNIDQALVGYYAFEDNLNDGAGTPQNGIARLAGGAPGAVGFAAGRFGRSLELNGSNYVTIGDAVAPADATFTGNSPLNNLASNPANWDLNPALLTPDQGIIVADGTSAVFAGPNSGPAIFNSSFPVSVIKNMTFGRAGQTTFLEFTGNVNLIGVGADSRVGVGGSTVDLKMSGNARLEHRGSAEEAQELIVAQHGSTVNLSMADSAELSTGPRVVDPMFATGFRRPLTTDPPSTPPRHGDDLKFITGSGSSTTQTNLQMGQNTTIFVVDVLYPLDGRDGVLNVVQNDNSRVIVNWDTRFLDTGGHDGNDVVNWTMNHNSQFLVARDHGLGEQAGTGVVNLRVNDNAQFFAGDRIVLGAGGGNVNVFVKDNGLIKVGGNSPSDVLLVDETGVDAVGTARDWILHMGAGANARLNVQGGRVEVGRSAYIGRGGGTAQVVMRGGRFEVKGVGPVGVGLGNSPHPSVPGNVNWTSNGGDLIVAYDGGDVGTFTFGGGTVSVARDMIISFDNDFNGLGGEGTFQTRTHDIASSNFTVGGDLSFAGDSFAASGSASHFEVIFDGQTLTPLTVNGNLYIYNSGGSTSDIKLSRALGGFAPSVGQYVLIDYAGSRFGDMFTKLSTPGISYDVIYDAVNTRVVLNVTSVNWIDADFNNDLQLNCTDVDALVGSIAGGTNPSAFDLTGDGFVNQADLTQWLAEAGARNLPSGNPYLPGDANLDGVVDGGDFGIWNANKSTSTPRWCAGDFNADGSVGPGDFAIWNGNKFRSSNDSGVFVPEPSTLVGCFLIGWALTGCLRRRLL